MSTLAPAKTQYRPALDGLRGFAITFVLIEHAFPKVLPFGYMGVDIFFVLSGYVVTLSLLRSDSIASSASLSDFFVRRFKRLAPALYFTVLFFSLVYFLFVFPYSPESNISIFTGLASLFGFSNIYLFYTNQDYFSILSFHNLFLHTWSLGIEEQFYLVFPILFFLCKDRRLFVFTVIIIAFVSYILQMHYLSLPEDYNSAFYLPISRFWQLLLGSIAAFCLGFFMSIINKFSFLIINIFTFVFSFSILYGVYTGYHVALSSTYSLLTLNVFILILLLERNSLCQSFFKHPLFVFFGLRSYSIYLFHWPLLVISSWIFLKSPLAILLTLVLSIVMSVFSYRYLENPFRLSSFSLQPKYIFPFFFSSSTIISVLSYSAYLSSRWLYLGDVKKPKSSVQLPFLPHRASAPNIPDTLLNRSNCFKRFSYTPNVFITQKDLSHCHLAPFDGKPTIFLYGDSFAAHLSPLLAKAHRDLGYGVEILTRARCPFPPRYLDSNKACNQFFLERQKRLFNAASSGDILLLATSAREPSGRYTNYFISSLTSLVSRLRSIGVRVIYQDPLPRFTGTFEPVCTYPLQWFQPRWPEWCLSPFKVSRESEINRVSPLNAQLLSISSKFDNFYVFQSFNQVCPSSSLECSTNDQSGRLFRDGIHLSNYGSTSLYPSFLRILSSSKSKMVLSND